MKMNAIFIKYLPWLSHVFRLIMTCFKMPSVTGVSPSCASSKFRIVCHLHIKLYQQAVQCVIAVRSYRPSILLCVPSF
jgi:hypothetical protein